MVARKVSLQHKVLLGYMILIMAVCGMVSILLYERSRMREIKTETSEIRRIRHDISTAHRYITELATYGESVIVWEDTDFREYRRKRLQTDSLLRKRLLNYILCIRFFIEVHSIVSASRFFHMPTYLRVVIECQSRFFPFFPAFSRNCPDYFLHTSGSSSFRSLSDLGAR